MKIHLSNFKNIDDAVYEFVDQTFTLISGPSGIGKTSILAGIVFAVTGQGKQLVRYGTRKMSVRLVIDDVEIYRQKGPGKLVVKVRDIEYTEKVAEGIIAERFKDFELGYVCQKMSKSFLLSTPMEKLKYIEPLAFDKTYVDELVSRVKTLINDRKTELIEKKATQSAQIATLTTLGIGRRDDPPPESYTEDDKVKVENDRRRLERDVADSLAAAERRKKLDARLDETLRDIEVMSKKIKKWCDCGPDDDITVAELGRVNNEAVVRRSEYAAYQKAESYLAALEKPRYDEAELDELASYGKRAAERQKIERRIVALKRDLRKITKPVPPACLDGTADEFERAIDDKRAVDAERRDKITAHLASLPKIAKRNELLREIRQLQDSMPRTPYTDADERAAYDAMAIVLELEALEDVRDELTATVKKRDDNIRASACPHCNRDVGVWNGQLMAIEKKNKGDGKSVSAAEQKRIDATISSLERSVHRRNELTASLAKLDVVDPAGRLAEIKKTRELRARLEKASAVAACIDVTGLPILPGVGEIEAKKMLADLVRESAVDAANLKRVKAYVRALADYERLVAENESVRGRIQELQHSLDELPSAPKKTPSLKEVAAERAALTEYNFALRRALDLKCEPCDVDCTLIDSLLAAMARKKSLEEERRELGDGDSELDELNKRLDEVIFELDQITVGIEDAVAYERWKDVKSVRDVIEVLEISFPRATRLKAMIVEAEMVALSEVIKELNFYTPLYVDRFFDNLSIEFTFEGKIEARIINDGHETDVSALSGGELARLNLAVTMAFTEIRQLDTLMLDEVLASLDQESTDRVLGAIKETFRGTVLCIAHQTVEGVFDSVIYPKKGGVKAPGATKQKRAKKVNGVRLTKK